MSARDQGDPRARRASTIRLNAECIACREARGDRRRGSTASAASDARSRARTCCSPSGGAPNTRRPRPRGRRHRDRRARLHQGRRRAAHERRRASGRSATATAAAPSPTPRTTTTRSSPRTCSTATRAASTDRIPAYALFIDPPLGRVRHDRARSARVGRKALVGNMADDPRRARARARRDAGLHEDHRRRARRSRSSARRCSASRATRSSTSILDVMYAERAVHGDRARDAHPSDRRRADPGHARGAAATDLAPTGADHRRAIKGRASNHGGRHFPRGRPRSAETSFG